MVSLSKYALALFLVKAAQASDPCKDGEKEVFVKATPQTDLKGGNFNLKSELKVWDSCKNEVLAQAQIDYDTTQNNKVVMPFCIPEHGNPIQLCFGLMNSPYWYEGGDGTEADGDPCFAFGDGYRRHLTPDQDPAPEKPVPVMCCSDPIGDKECSKYEKEHCGAKDENCCVGDKCHTHGDDDTMLICGADNKCVDKDEVPHPECNTCDVTAKAEELANTIEELNKKLTDLIDAHNSEKCGLQPTRKLGTTDPTDPGFQGTIYQTDLPEEIHITPPRELMCSKKH